MKPLFVLLSTFLVALLVFKFKQDRYNLAYSARIAISIMLLFTALGHFLFTTGMAMMLPDFIPLKKEVIYFTAIIEVLGAIGLHLSNHRVIAAWLLILFLILILPANIKASIEGLNYQTGTYDKQDSYYLWFRIPLQIVFIIWIYISAIRHQ